MTKKLIFFVLIATFAALPGARFVLAVDTTTTPSAAPSSVSEEIQVLNQEIANRKDKISQLESTIAGYKKVIAEKQNQAVSLKNQLSILDNRAAQMQADIDLTKIKIEQKQLQIDSLKLTIAAKEKTLAKQKSVVAKMIEQVHANDQRNYVEIMLSYGSFADFYNQAKTTENVYIDIGRSVKEVRLAKEDLDARKKQVEAEQKAYQDLQTQLTDQKDGLVSQQTEKQVLLNQTKASESQYQTLLASLKKQYQVIEAEQQSFEDKIRKKLAEQNKMPASGDLVLSWPTPSHYINAAFHDSDYPFRKVFEHSGLDIKAAYGTPLRATASGYVARAKHCATAACYSYILIVHTSSISTVYGHLSRINVEENQFVNRGDIIGYSGGTPGTVGAGPFVTGAHLHFEVRKNGIPVDPAPYLE